VSINSLVWEGSDHQILQETLIPIVGKKSKDIASELIDHFGTLHDLMHASVWQYPPTLAEKQAICGVFKLGGQLAYTLAEHSLKQRRITDLNRDMDRFAQQALHASHQMTLRCIYLTEENEFLGSEIITKGTSHHLQWYSSNIMGRCLHWSAEKFVLIHTNPKSEHRKRHGYTVDALHLMHKAAQLGVELAAYYFVSLGQSEDLLSTKRNC